MPSLRSAFAVPLIPNGSGRRNGECHPWLVARATFPLADASCVGGADHTGVVERVQSELPGAETQVRPGNQPTCSDLLAAALALSAPATIDRPAKTPHAIEKMLHRAWKGEGACQGDIRFNADG